MRKKRKPSRRALNRMMARHVFEEHHTENRLIAEGKAIDLRSKKRAAFMRQPDALGEREQAEFNFESALQMAMMIRRWRDELVAYEGTAYAESYIISIDEALVSVEADLIIMRAHARYVGIQIATVESRYEG